MSANELDIERPEQLLAYLRRTGRIDTGEQPHIVVLAGGVSNRTVRVDRPTGESWVLKQALEQLRTKAEWHSSPLRIHREAMGLRWLEQLAPPGATTPLVFEDHEHHLLAMQAVPQPHANWKTLLLDGQVVGEHVEQFARLLGQVHRRAYEQRGRLASEFDDRSFFESLRIEPYYSYTAAQVPEANRFLSNLVEDTRARRLTLVHGDYSPKNILVFNGRLVLLDHEVIHWGDPAFDLGFSLTHLLSKAHYLPHCRERFAHAAVLYWQVYGQTLGDLPWAADLEPFAVRHTLGCLLARVSGRSLLEYFDDEHRSRQGRAVVDLMARPPATVPDLVEQFTERVRANAND